MFNNDNVVNLFVKELKGMFNKVANKQQSGLQYPANGKPNDGNCDEVGDGDDDNDDDDDNGDDDACHGDDIDDDVKMMVATKDWGELMIHSSDIWR